MIFLLLSILTSVITVSFFKLFERYNVHTLQAIIGNYIFCVVIGNLIEEKAIITTPFWNEGWFPYACVLGFLFISIFYCIGETTQKMGVSVSMVAAKLSVIIPVIAAVALHHERLSLLQTSGIILSLMAVYLISKKEDAGGSPNRYNWLLPAIVFVGSGLIDTLLHFVETHFIPPSDAGSIVSTIFLIAGILGSIVLVVQRVQLRLKHILWGFALGVPNYFSMFFLVKTLGTGDASMIFPVNNMGIVICSTLASMLFFHEKLNRMNWIGFVLALFSILIISLG